MPLHILLIHQSFASLDEAGGTRHHEFARYLASLGFRVTILTSSVSYLSGKQEEQASHRWLTEEKDGDRITILRAYAYPALHRSFISRVAAFASFMVSSFVIGLRVPSVDLVWGTSPPIFQGVSAWLVARLKRVPFLFEIRDLWPAFAVQVGVLRNPVLIRASEALERFLYRRADRVMVNSPGFIQHVTARGARQVELIPNGADPEMFSPTGCGESFRSQYHLEDDFIAMYAGAHGLANDLGVVLAAAKALQDEPSIRIVLLGDGKERSALIEEAGRSGLTNVLFIPALPKNKMAEALAAADACIAILKPIPLFATTYPNKVFDYMAAGRPVILAIDGVIREVVESTGGGGWVPPGDAAALAQAIRQMAHLPDRGRSMGAAGRTAVERNYSRSLFARRLALLLEEMRRGNGR